MQPATFGWPNDGVLRSSNAVCKWIGNDSSIPMPSRCLVISVLREHGRNQRILQWLIPVVKKLSSWPHGLRHISTQASAYKRRSKRTWHTPPQVWHFYKHLENFFFPALEFRTARNWVLETCNWRFKEANWKVIAKEGGNVQTGIGLLMAKHHHCHNIWQWWRGVIFTLAVARSGSMLVMGVAK